MTRIHLAIAALLFLVVPSLTAQQPETAPLPQWREQGVCYEVFVRSFYDSDGDGIGDLRGLVEKLDYIADLGATCIWLMPISPSPSYHGYDVTNYYEVNRDYGTPAGFRLLMTEANRRGIRVLKDLVLNHLSREHPFFQSALIREDSPYRDWFLWSPVERHTEGWGHPTWHPVPDRDEYYYGLFWGGMPDFNLHNAEVVAKLRDVTRFWLEEMGVDGFRLDAVAHFFEGPEGEWKHWPDVHPWLRDYQAFIRSVNPDAFTIGEVWDGTDAILPYYPDQLDSYFIFEVADGIIHAARDGTAAPLIAAVEKAQREIPAGRWSPFIRNHDQTRTMTELGGQERRARLAATLLLTLPGFPFLYYGEEIGMMADKPDPRLRTPMHWEPRPGVGFTTGQAWAPLQPDSLTANVAVQDGDPDSLLNHHRRLIRLRARHPALGASARFIPMETGNDGVIAYLRQTASQTVLVVANLGDAPVRRLAVASPDGVLEPGRYNARPLFGAAGQSAVPVGRDGRIQRWVPVPTLAPFEGYILEIAH